MENGNISFGLIWLLWFYVYRKWKPATCFPTPYNEYVEDRQAKHVPMRNEDKENEEPTWEINAIPYHGL